MAEQKQQKKKDNTTKILVGIAVVLLIIVVYNGFKMGKSGDGPESKSGILSTGVPNIYGPELGVSFSDVSTATPRKADATIGKMAALDRAMTLTGDDLDRYIRVVSEISCEYCCGAQSIIFSDGRPACGCAHSFAMRGLAKYLIKNHGAEFSDDEILAELGKWKVLFFPDIHIQKAEALKANGIEVSYVNLASNAYRGIEQGATGGGMVGGC